MLVRLRAWGLGVWLGGVATHSACPAEIYNMLSLNHPRPSLSYHLSCTSSSEGLVADAQFFPGCLRLAYACQCFAIVAGSWSGGIAGLLLALEFAHEVLLNSVLLPDILAPFLPGTTMSH